MLWETQTLLLLTFTKRETTASKVGNDSMEINK